jgi:hypothetical protein
MMKTRNRFKLTDKNLKTIYVVSLVTNTSISTISTLMKKNKKTMIEIKAKIKINKTKNTLEEITKGFQQKNL